MTMMAKVAPSLPNLTNRHPHPENPPERDSEADGKTGKGSSAVENAPSPTHSGSGTLVAGTPAGTSHKASTRVPKLLPSAEAAMVTSTHVAAARRARLTRSERERPSGARARARALEGRRASSDENANRSIRGWMGCAVGAGKGEGACEGEGDGGGGGG